MSVLENIDKAKNGDVAAFTELVKSHQNLVLGFAYSKLGDFQKAQDVVQDTFLAAYSQLDQLNDNRQFSSWLKGIANFKCHRVFRKNYRPLVPFNEDYVLSPEEDLDDLVQSHQEKSHLVKAISSLPEKYRVVITLFYLEEHSQDEIASFLEIPTTKVNNYMHEARKLLKGRLVKMAGDTFREQRLSEEFAKNIGEIISINGPLIDARMSKKNTKGIFDVLGSKASEKTHGDEIIVIQRLKDGRFRCLSTGENVSKKAKLFNSSNPPEKAYSELSDESIEKAVHSITSNGKGKILETGIKAVDLLCPIQDGRNLGIFGRDGVGRIVLVMEILKRKQNISGDVAIFMFVDRMNIQNTRNILDMELREELGFATDINENIQTAWIVHDKAGDPFYAESASYLDSRIYFSPLKAIQGLWPAIDPIHSHSNILREDIVGSEHYDTAVQVKEYLKKSEELLDDPVFLKHLVLGARAKALEQRENFVKQRMKELSENEKTIVDRALKLECYFTQPFFVAEEFTQKKGVAVNLEDTILGARKIINGEFDRINKDDLMWKGSI